MYKTNQKKQLKVRKLRKKRRNSKTIVDNKYKEKTNTNNKQKTWLSKKIYTITRRRFWMRKIPIIGYLNSYNISNLISDIISGITIALTFIPGYMVSARLAGLPPQYGLYGCIVCYFAYAILGSEPCVIIGPMALTALICTPFVEIYGIEIAATISFYTGILVFILGLLNMGFIVNLISTPVLNGFISSACVIALSVQIGPILGMSGGGSTIIQIWKKIGVNLGENNVQLWDTVIGLSSLILLITLEKLSKYSKISESEKMDISLRKKIFKVFFKYVCLARTAVVLVLFTIIVAIVTLTSENQIPPVRVAGNITAGLPDLVFPRLIITHENQTYSFLETISTLTPAITIPLIVIMECSAAGMAFARGPSIDAVQELLAAGCANIGCSLVQSAPASASIVRTMVNHEAGAKTPIVGIYAGLIVLGILGLFSSTLRFLPISTLAAITISVVYKLILIHTHTKYLFKTNRKDLIPLHVTFFSALFLGLDYGMILGITINLILLISYTIRPQIQVNQLKIYGKTIILIKPITSIDYPGVDKFRKSIIKPLEKHRINLYVIIDGTHIIRIDSTALKVLHAIIKEINKLGHKIIFWKWENNLLKKLDNKSNNNYDETMTLEDIVTNECMKSFQIPEIKIDEISEDDLNTDEIVNYDTDFENESFYSFLQSSDDIKTSSEDENYLV